MGFLDHSTNNIIVDAVLTEKGRQALAAGTFSIDKFSLSDDEVDYTIIQKFGRTVGKEKIIKNTPIFEAHTNSDLAQKHRILTVSGQGTNLFMPTVEITPANGTVTFNNTTAGSVPAQTVTIEQKIQGVSNINDYPFDNNFFVYIPKRFLSIVGVTDLTDSAAETRDTLMYSISGETATSGLSKAVIQLQPVGLDDTIFNTFGTNSAKNRIDCVVSVVGESSGIRTTLNVILNKLC